MCTCMHIYTHTSVYLYFSILIRANVYIYVYICTCIYHGDRMCVCVRMCMCVCSCICDRDYEYICVNIYIYIRMEWYKFKYTGALWSRTGFKCSLQIAFHPQANRWNAKMYTCKGHDMCMYTCISHESWHMYVYMYESWSCDVYVYMYESWVMAHVCIHVWVIGKGHDMCMYTCRCVCHTNELVMSRTCMSREGCGHSTYGVATVSSIDKMIGLFCRIASHL